MDTYDTGMAPRFNQMLLQRASELREMLQPETCLADMAGTRDVMDFKDAAIEESRATIDEAQAACATRELGQILVALRRLSDRSYGYCEDCGDPIDLRRLAALPATAYCTACQTFHEHERARH